MNITLNGTPAQAITNLAELLAFESKFKVGQIVLDPRSFVNPTRLRVQYFSDPRDTIDGGQWQFISDSLILPEEYDALEAYLKLRS